MHGVDWKAGPKNAVWCAGDEDGTAHWFKSPNVVPFTAFWFAEQEAARLYGFAGDWRESLTMKPL
jgi:hypothetical protein